MKNPKSDQEIENNPFLHLGYGMNSYLDVIKELMWMTLVVSLIMLPIMLSFSSYSALEK